MPGVETIPGCKKTMDSLDGGIIGMERDQKEDRGICALG